MNKISCAVALSLVLFTGSVTIRAQSSTVPWSTFGSGYAFQTGGTNHVRALVGQVIAGRSSGSGNMVSAGFFPGAVMLGGGTTGVMIADESLPREFALMQNYPNPFNPTTTVRYDLPTQSHVTLKVYDLLGREVNTVVDAQQEPGRYAITWDGKTSSGHSASSGVYLYSLQTSPNSGGVAFARTMKMMLLK